MLRDGCYIPNMLMLFLAMFTGSSAMPADLSKGAHLYSSCQAAVRLSDDLNSAQAKGELASSTYCFGYVGGYIDGLNVLKKRCASAEPAWRRSLAFT